MTMRFCGKYHIFCAQWTSIFSFLALYVYKKYFSKTLLLGKVERCFLGKVKHFILPTVRIIGPIIWDMDKPQEENK